MNEMRQQTDTLSHLIAALEMPHAAFTGPVPVIMPFILFIFHETVIMFIQALLAHLLVSSRVWLKCSQVPPPTTFWETSRPAASDNKRCRPF